MLIPHSRKRRLVPRLFTLPCRNCSLGSNLKKHNRQSLTRGCCVLGDARVENKSEPQAGSVPEVPVLLLHLSQTFIVLRKLETGEVQAVNFYAAWLDCLSGSSGELHRQCPGVSSAKNRPQTIICRPQMRWHSCHILLEGLGKN